VLKKILLIFLLCEFYSMPALSAQQKNRVFSCANPVVAQSNISIPEESITWKTLDANDSVAKNVIDESFNQLLNSKLTVIGTNASIPSALADNLFEHLEQQIKSEARKKNRRVLAQTNKIWPTGSNLRVAFDFSGTRAENFDNYCSGLSDADCQTKVKDYILNIAGQWSEHGNIYFSLSNNWDYADIRISFSQSGAWSKVGTDARTVNPAFATMNFHYSSWQYPELLRSTVLHEFGHAIGLRHEHKSPKVPFKINQQAAYDLYFQEFGWNQEQVKNNVILLLNESETPLFVGDFDNQSIMIYPFPRSIIEDDSLCPSSDNYFCVKPTTTLSDYDKESIKQVYYYTESVVTVVKKDTNARNQVVWEIDIPALIYEGNYYKVRMVNQSDNNSQFLLVSAQQIDKPNSTNIPVFNHNKIEISKVELRVSGEVSSFYQATLELKSKNANELIFAVTQLTEIESS